MLCDSLYMLQVQRSLKVGIANKKTPAQGGREVIEAGFIQARNLSSSDTFISNPPQGSKLKV
jgi:hypothetical protein